MKKDFISSILSSIIISFGIIVAGYLVSNTNTTTFHMPDTLYVESSTSIDKEFLSFYDAAKYLSIDEASLNLLITTSQNFSSTYITIGEEYIFSRSKLSDYLYRAIEKGEYY